MSEHRRLFVDGISDISLINGVVHVTCANLERQDGEDDKAMPENSVKLALTVQGFLQSYGQMASMVRVMKENGVIRTKEADIAAE